MLKKPPEILKHAKTLILDIEMFANISHTWGTWKQHVIKVEKERMVCCMGWKWLDDPQIHIPSLPDFYGYPRGKSILDTYPTNRKLMQALAIPYEEADVVVAYNGAGFDEPQLNQDFLLQGFKPFSPHLSYDPLKFIRRKFRMNSNRLDEVARVLGLQRKIKHTGYDLWDRCMRGDKKAWAEMILYCGQDVLVLEQVYLKTAAWDDKHPDLSNFRRDWNCPFCGSGDKQIKSYKYNVSSVRVQYKCGRKGCGRYYLGPSQSSKKVHR